MKLASPILVLPILLLGAGAMGQTADQGVSSIEVQPVDTALAAHIVNRAFVFDSRWHFGAEGPTRLMLEITTDTTQRDDAEGYSAATVEATAWELAAGGRKQLWNLREPGNAG